MQKNCKGLQYIRIQRYNNTKQGMESQSRNMSQVQILREKSDLHSRITKSGFQIKQAGEESQEISHNTNLLQGKLT